MFIVLGALLMLRAPSQGGQTAPRQQAAVVRDSTPADSARRRAPRRLAVTDEALRTAYRDDGARTLILRARRERLTQDSTLTSYDATARQRFTARLTIGSHGPERVIYREESAFRVGWHAGVGARVELTGARVGLPMAPGESERESLVASVTEGGGMTPIPYFPGQESFWPAGSTVRADVDDRNIVHPLAIGAEAYYTYASGDSMTWTLPGGRAIHLREVAIRPRWPKWNLAVGSLWFDASSGQLVRAAYRLAVPMDVWATMNDRPRVEGAGTNPILAAIAKAIVSPIRIEISAVVIEYGLFEGRYWLPRSRSLEGAQQISFAHLPIDVEQSFSYTTINGPGASAPIAINAPPIGRLEVPDSLSDSAARHWRDSALVARQAARTAFSDSLKKAPCDSTGHRVVSRMRGDIAVAETFPCDVASLAASPDFDKPLYDANEQLFGTAERDALLSDALPFGAQALINFSELPKPNLQYGLSLTRYNRIEGLSTGLLVEQQLGAGYAASALARLGAADREPNGELSLSRTNLTKTLTFTGYHRLVAANDWGSPLSFGSSVSALLFGRDEGFYYRASGAELKWTDQRAQLEWRLFGEQQRTAVQRTDYSFGAPFVPNIVAATGPSLGTGVRWLHTLGVDPRGFRAVSDLRAEAATGDSTYGRAALDVTLSTGLPKSFGAALTLAGGSSVGQLPAQRRWFLGGTQTIRGESPDTAQSGNAFWMSRFEIGPDRSGYRVLLFGDLGWVGDRSAITTGVRPMSSAGVGLSMFDGFVRVDVARGFYPREQTRVSAYLQARY